LAEGSLKTVGSRQRAVKDERLSAVSDQLKKGEKAKSKKRIAKKQRIGKNKNNRAKSEQVRSIF
jgi:hypothetical protein